jgi:hypothetical protein
MGPPAAYPPPDHPPTGRANRSRGSARADPTIEKHARTPARLSRLATTVRLRYSVRAHHMTL